MSRGDGRLENGSEASVSDQQVTEGTATQAGLLTPAHPAAIATIALRGPLVFEIVARAFRSAGGQRSQLEIADVRYGLWSTQMAKKMPPEHVVLCRTGRLEFEIHCHGGLAICKLLLQDLQDLGCDICDGGQWSTTQPLSIEAAAELALPYATTLKVAAVLLDQANGSLSRELRQVAGLIRAARRDEARVACESLLGRGVLGVRLLEPWRVTLAGPPNAGKSSLINALVGASRVLVHHEPGTTRDAIDSAIVVSSWPVVITDTAGLRASQEAIEQQGIEIAWQRWQTADIGLLVVDATVGWTDVHSQLIEQRSQPILIVLNKQDLQSANPMQRDPLPRIDGLKTAGGSVTVVSTRATQPDGICQLLSALGEYFDTWLPPAGSGVPFLPEQITLLRTLIAQLDDHHFDEAERLINRALE